MSVLNQNISNSPFLKWAGGKRWFVKKHLNETPEKFITYIEPFLGGGSMFFALCPEKAVLSDYNYNLINCYLAIKEMPHVVYEYLTQHHQLHNKEYYYEIRKSKFENSAQKAAQFIYLNRTCWNALYRVNLKGEFNVPIGTKTNVILETDNFISISKFLEKVDLKCCDFEETINNANKGDFIFVDPPYTVKHNNNGFVKYNEVMFSWDDQIRLSKALIRAHERGVYFLMTNAYHQSVIDLYANDFLYKKISRHSVIASESNRRGIYDELLVKNY